MNKGAMDTLRSLRTRSRTFLEHQQQLLASSFSALPLGREGSTGGQHDPTSPTSPSALPSPSASSASSPPSSPSPLPPSQSGTSAAAEDEEELESVKFDRLPPPCADLEDGTVLKNVHIRDCVIRREPSPHTVYIIDVCTMTNSWAVCRRYSDFVRLHAQLRKRFGNVPASLPPKVPNKFAGKIIESRKNALEGYLAEITSNKTFLKSDEVYSFLEIHLYDVAAVVNMLAIEGISAQDGFLEEAQFKFPLNPTFLYCISTRLHQLWPDYHRGYDFTLVPNDHPSHLLRFSVFVQKLKTLKVSSSYWKRPAADPTEELASYRDPRFDVAIFECISSLQIKDFDLSLFSDVHVLQPQIMEIECNSNQLTSFKNILIDLVNMSGNGSTIIAKTWSALRKITVSRNKISCFDDSLSLAPHLQEIDASHNLIQEIDNLQSLHALHRLDVSHNRITSVEGLNLNLGNIHTLNLAGNQLETLHGIEKLYSLQHLDVSSNLISEINETNRLGELPFLASLVVRGNPFCENRGFRVHIFGYLKDQPPHFTIDGEEMSPREKPLVDELQERIKQEKARVTTRSLIAKKKKKSRVADIQAPKKKKDKMGPYDPSSSANEMNANGLSVADSIHVDVDRILSSLREAGEVLEDEPFAEESGSLEQPPGAPSPHEEAEPAPPLPAATEAEAPKHRDSRARRGDLDQNKDKRLSRRDLVVPTEPSEEIVRVIERLKGGQDLSNDSPVSFSAVFEDLESNTRYCSIFNFDLESEVLLEINEDTGKLKGNWKFTELNLAKTLELAKAQIGQEQASKPQVHLELSKEAHPLRVFFLDSQQALVDLAALVGGLLPLYSQAPTPRPAASAAALPRPQSQHGNLHRRVSKEETDLVSIPELRDSIQAFLRQNSREKDATVLHCIMAPFLMFRASPAKERQALVVPTLQHVFLLSWDPEEDLEEGVQSCQVLHLLPLSSIQRITVGFFDQQLRLENDENSTVSIITRNPLKTNILLTTLRECCTVLEHPIKVSYATEEVAEELMSYLSFEDPSKGLQIVDYLLVFQAVRDPKTGRAAQLPRTLILSEMALYLMDEDYTSWPPPFFQEGYNYLSRAPYQAVSQYKISDLSSVETFKVAPTSLALGFESQEDGHPVWELTCSRKKQKDQFISLLNAAWNRMYQSDLLISEV